MIYFTISDLDAVVHYKLKYTPDVEPQFETIVGDSHVWLWDMFQGCLLRDGSTQLLDGGNWSITIEQATV